MAQNLNDMQADRARMLGAFEDTTHAARKRLEMLAVAAMATPEAFIKNLSVMLEGPHGHSTAVVLRGVVSIVMGDVYIREEERRLFEASKGDPT